MRHKLTGSALTARVGQWTQAGLIKRIQSAVITMAGGNFSGTATIAAVSLNDAVLIWLGTTYDTAAAQPTASLATTVFTNATTITCARNTSIGQLVTTCLVVEFVPGVIKSLQNVSITMAGVTSNTATITSVNTLKTVLLYGGVLTNAPTNDDESRATVVLTNSTTVTATRGSAASTTTIVCQVAELY